MSDNSIDTFVNLRQLSAFLTYRDYLFRLHRTHGLQGRDIRLLVVIALTIELNMHNEVTEGNIREVAMRQHQIRTTVIDRLANAGMINKRKDKKPYKYSLTPQGQRIIDAFLYRANFYLKEISKRDTDKNAKMNLLFSID